MTNGTVRAKIIVRGIVQGVGFRPFVYRLAKELGIRGQVNNTSAGLFIEAESDHMTIDSFLHRLHKEKPLHSYIYGTETTLLDPVGSADFTITESNGTNEPATLILPDIAVCGECLNEMLDPANRRYRYPFINCTHCGPRYSIIRSLPYDRPNTTMKQFEMCSDCEREYRDPDDRRFHAQPIACPKCGPHIELWNNAGNVLSLHGHALDDAVHALRGGKIVALKGLGGFQLLCDATNDDSVKELRRRKGREEKPFALMFSSLWMVEQCCRVSQAEQRLLNSPESPIVLLQRNVRTTDHDCGIASSVAPRNPYLGVMLPYTPLHHLMMSGIGIPIVATSGNIAEEPMCIDEHEALRKLGGMADLFLVHDRPIKRYVDDSIVRVVCDREMVVRRARGYAPLPLILSETSDDSVLAVGGHLKNTIAVQRREMIFVSQHIGDLETAPALECFNSAIGDVESLFDLHPDTVVHDNHPEYISTSIALALPGKQESFQHHFAHVASCMAEHELDEPLLGVAWDGTGYGLDGTIWGGECIEFDGKDFSRFASLRSYRLPGGDAAARDAVRSAVGLLYEMHGTGVFHHQFVRGKYTEKEERLILQMLEKNINSPRTTSMGRLFDAVGAILGIRDRSTFEGQTAMDVEFIACGTDTDEYYPLILSRSIDPRWMIDWGPMINSMLSERPYCDAATLARKFHNTLVEIIVAVARRSPYKKIVLSGGCFQNMLLLERSIVRLREEGFIPYWHQRIPTNDAGISVGQIYMHHLHKNKSVGQTFLFDHERTCLTIKD